MAQNGMNRPKRCIKLSDIISLRDTDEGSKPKHAVVSCIHLSHKQQSLPRESQRRGSRRQCVEPSRFSSVDPLSFAGSEGGAAGTAGANLMTILRLTRLVLRAALSLAALLAVLWATAALWIDGPDSRLLAGTLAGCLLLTVLLFAFWIRPFWRALGAVLVPFAVVLAWWLSLEPSNDRDWRPEVARLPTATIDGSKLTIRNVRSFRYSSEDSFTEHWETRTYDLDTLVGGDIFISFWGPELYGHTIASWEFNDGRHLAVSIETRKERGEQYSALRGFFRQFELYYVVADEADVVALRTNHRGERVELYRTLSPPGAERELLLDYLREINALAENPRWYNALTHNCTTTIWHHIKAVGADFPMDWRLLANGYLAELAYELGTVNTSIGFHELKKRSDITARARATGSDEAFSESIREGLPERPGL